MSNQHTPTESALMDDFSQIAYHAAMAQAMCAKLTQRLAGERELATLQRHLTALYHQLVAATFTTVCVADAVAEARARGVKI